MPQGRRPTGASPAVAVTPAAVRRALRSVSATSSAAGISRSGLDRTGCRLPCPRRGRPPSRLSSLPSEIAPGHAAAGQPAPDGRGGEAPIGRGRAGPSRGDHPQPLRRVRRRGLDRGDQPRPGDHRLRAPAGARRQGEPGGQPAGRPGPGAARPSRCASTACPAARRWASRCPTASAPSSAWARCSPTSASRSAPSVLTMALGHRHPRRALLRRPRHHAPPAGGGRHRRRQERRPAEHDHLHPLQGDARRGAVHLHRPQADRAGGLRRHPAPEVARWWSIPRRRPTRCAGRSPRWSAATACSPRSTCARSPTTTGRSRTPRCSERLSLSTRRGDVHRRRPEAAALLRGGDRRAGRPDDGRRRRTSRPRSPAWRRWRARWAST